MQPRVPTPFLTVLDVAIIAHDTNRSYCIQTGDLSQPGWPEAPDWQKQSAISGVEFHLVATNAGPEASHNNWMAEKVAAGWVYGPVKDPEASPPTHPCILPFDQLPEQQQAKDHLFRAIVHALAPFVDRG